MKCLKLIKVIDLVMSILLIGIFFYRYQITEAYEYGLGQLIQLFFLVPVLVLLLFSLLMAVLSLFYRKAYLFSILGQIFKMLSFLANCIILSFFYGGTIKVDYLVIIPIYSTIVLLILIFLRKNSALKKVN